MTFRQSRRKFLSGSILGGAAALPRAARPQTAMPGPTGQTSVQPRLIRVPAGADRFGEHHTLGVSLTDFKVATGDARGGLFVLEHTNRKKGGVVRHLHHNEDEWFYVIEGDYIAEIGGERFRLKPGDSVLGPREVPHAWAFVSDAPGKLLIALAPANKMEEYFHLFKARSGAYSNWNNPQDIERSRAYGIELLGPPLAIE